MVTKILISKEDKIKDTMNRQIIFGPDGKPVLHYDRDKDSDLDDGDAFSEEAKSESESEQSMLPMIEKMRQELAMDEKQQKRLLTDLNVPKFDAHEKVEVN